MWTLGIELFKWLTLLWIVNGIDAIRVVSLDVPAKVKKGEEVHLTCLYELGNNSLYSLKWFFSSLDSDKKDEKEFFRFTPRGKPKKQYFPIPGINVDMGKSNGGQLIISETNGNTSGRYKCEISVEGTFQTVDAAKLMTVEANASPSMMDNKLIITIIVLSCIISHYLSLTISYCNSCATFEKLSSSCESSGKRELINGTSDSIRIRKGK